jgi:hypothetical protein
MGKAAVIGAVVVIMMIIGTYLILKIHTRGVVGDLNRKQEREMRQLLTEAAHVMAGLGVGITIEDTDVISDRSRRAIDRWAQRYNHYQQKEINA